VNLGGQQQLNFAWLYCSAGTCTQLGGAPAPTAICSDGTKDIPYETCDDGNKGVGDGCNAQCLCEPCPTAPATFAVTSPANSAILNPPITTSTFTWNAPASYGTPTDCCFCQNFTHVLGGVASAGRGFVLLACFSRYLASSRRTSAHLRLLFDSCS
jgi:cysteine-rich repeat protein